MADKYDADTAFITALAKLLNDTDLTEIEVGRKFGEDDKLEVRVSRQTVQQVVAAPAPVAAPAAAPAPASAAAPAAASAPAAEAPTDPAQLPGAVTSPMVGTVYLQAEPGAPSFVSVGDQVAEGQTLLIIEAMKTMNQIPSPKAGKVARILVGDGEPVEFGAPLVVIE
ncbi:acetyl-CoA carboxylase biotin carboxyl carrier protein [Pontivivens insulae]|uniref:Biotin carboxyl carrier protein of acetyl-CoA carboxylase n=1 Tax=Pontivivens insulae TaxID=1639689 RepID=A0A2R8ABM5_9RHOB|nr:acetyl-CoA carboxylase biotin carboxyl carrier protein [Pontivivens insulae]RED11367.1 biotin carboxyl carrier protein [Pontivivens insulae]SPF29460.1 Biotin carboxyl carrier protein of acetyl-CoA carboxylase [Pontivivens insulae]